METASKRKSGASSASNSPKAQKAAKSLSGDKIMRTIFIPSITLTYIHAEDTDYHQEMEDKKVVGAFVSATLAFRSLLQHCMSLEDIGSILHSEWDNEELREDKDEELKYRRKEDFKDIRHPTEEELKTYFSTKFMAEFFQMKSVTTDSEALKHGISTLRSMFVNYYDEYEFDDGEDRTEVEIELTETTLNEDIDPEEEKY